MNKIKEALGEMVWQFAYRGVKNGKSILYTGGLSALESAFDALGWTDPKEFDDMEGSICDVDGCAEWASSNGAAWRDAGYWRLCDKHFKDGLDGEPQPKMKDRAVKREASRGADGRVPFKKVANL